MKNTHEYIGPYLLGPNETPENGIYTGDARKLAKDIPNESIDLIFTDPVYDRIDDYKWLAEIATRVLKEDSACLIWCGIGYLPKVLQTLIDAGLEYRWELTSAWNGGAARAPIGFCKQARLLWFDKNGTSKPYKKLVDYRQGVVARSKLPDNTADWAKIPDHQAYWLEGFTQSGAVVLDVFHGWGTTAVLCKLFQRQCLAFELLANRAEYSRDRLRKTQAPLPLVMPIQEALL